MIKFECHARRPDGERLYRLIINDKVVREGLTIDDVVEAINDRDGRLRHALHHRPQPGRDQHRAEPEDEEDESPTGCAGAPFRQGGQVSPEPEWMTGDPPRIGRYFCQVDMGDSKPHENRCWWGDDGWSCYGSNLKANGWKVVGWWPLPKEG